jgi:predicted phosphoribosyltransferase
MFRNREEAAFELAERLKDRALVDPVVLGIPRGGVVIGAILAQELGADLDVVLSRKLWAPSHPEMLIGAIAEAGTVYLSPGLETLSGWKKQYLVAECRLQSAEIRRRQNLFRKGRSPQPLKGRSVIVTDDGLATGSTLIAALQTLRAHQPYELIAAVPVTAPDSVSRVRYWCDELAYLLRPLSFGAIAEWYEDFPQIDEDQVVQLLRDCAPLYGVGGTAGAQPKHHHH